MMKSTKEVFPTEESPKNTTLYLLSLLRMVDSSLFMQFTMFNRYNYILYFGSGCPYPAPMNPQYKPIYQSNNFFSQVEGFEIVEFLSQFMVDELNLGCIRFQIDELLL